MYSVAVTIIQSRKVILIPKQLYIEFILTFLLPCPIPTPITESLKFFKDPLGINMRTVKWLHRTIQFYCSDEDKINK